MPLNLGNITFDLGANSRLQSSIRDLEKFSRVVDRTASTTANATARSTDSLRKQEAAAVSALNSVNRLTGSMQGIKGADAHIRRAEQAFSSLNRTMTSGALSNLEYQRAFERFRTEINLTQRSFGQFASRSKSVSNAFENVAASATLSLGPLSGFGSRLVALTSIMRRTELTAALMFAGFASGAASIGLFGLSILNAGKHMAQYISQLEAVTGSNEAAQAAMRKIVTIARLTGAAVGGLAPAYAKFSIAAQTAGFSAKTTEKIFTTVAMATTKLGMSVSDSEGVFRALEQMMSKGTVQAEELRGQLGDRLAGAVQIAAKAMGVTTQKLQEMMKKGELLTSDFLPKFADQLAEILHLDISKPIDNYAASVNNLYTAWFQLRTELDRQLGVTNTVMNLYKTLTGILDTIRTNLDTIKIYAIGAVGALAGIVAPAIIGGFAAILVSLGKIVFTVGALNKLLLATPIGIVLRLAAAIAGAGVALYEFRDQIRPVSGELATLGDWMEVIWKRAPDYIKTAMDSLKSYMATFLSTFTSAGANLADSTKVTWMEIAKTIATLMGYATDYVIKSLATIASVASDTFNNLLGGLKDVLSLLNEGRKLFAPWLDDPINGQQSNKGFKWFEENLGNREFKKTSPGQILGNVEDIWRKPSPNLGMQLEALVTQWQDEANQTGMSRIYNDPSRKQDIYTPPSNTSSAHADPWSNLRDASEISEKQQKAMERRAEAIRAVNDEIERTREEVEALGGTEATMEALTEKFKRDKEVERYAKAMRKAGVDTQTVTEKTKELYELLEKRDAMRKMAEGLEQMRDAWSSAFDGIADSFIDAVANGENAMDALKKAVKAAALDILKTFLQLSLLNPLKNWMFGTNEPTIAGPLSFLTGGGMSTAASSASSFQTNTTAGDFFSQAGGIASSSIGAGLSSGSWTEASQLSGFSGSNTLVGGSGAVDLAEGLMGFSEVGNVSSINSFLKAGGVDINAAQTAWCAAFVNSSLKQIGVDGTGNLTANSFLNWGKGVDVGSVMKGDVLVQSRGLPANVPGGHVGFATGASRSVGGVQQLEMLSGNTNGGKVDTEWVNAAKVDIRRATEGVGQLGGAAAKTTEAVGTMGKGLDDLGSGLQKAGQQLQSGASGGGGGGGGLGGFLKGIFGGGFGSSAGGGGWVGDSMGQIPFGAALSQPDWLTNWHTYAKGGIFHHGQSVHRFSRGSIFNQPTSFPMDGGTGMLGEAGAEAIMPLTKDSQGRLGVRASGAGGNDNEPSRIHISLDSGMIATILKESASQSIQISQESVSAFAKSREFESRASSAVNKMKSKRLGGRSV